MSDYEERINTRVYTGDPRFFSVVQDFEMVYRLVEPLSRVYTSSDAKSADDTYFGSVGYIDQHYPAIADDETITGSWTMTDLTIATSLTLTYPGQDWKLLGDGNNLEWRSQTAAQGAVIELSAADNDGSDDVLWAVDPVGNLGSADFEVMEWGWDAGNSRYEIRTRSQGTGSLRDIAILQGATVALTIDTSGNLTPGGTFDGRDVAADGSKLDNIEANADVTDAANVAAAGAVMDSDFGGTATGHLRRTGTATYEVIKDNLAATAAPAVTDDSGSGYAVDSRWIDVTNNEVYVCADASVGAAVWKQIGSGSGSGDVTAASNITDNAIVRGDGGAKGVQQSGVTISDTDQIAGATRITAETAGGHVRITGTIIRFYDATETNGFLELSASQLTYDTDALLTFDTGGVTLASGKALTIGGHDLTDAAVAADADTTSDSVLLTGGYLNARRATQAEMEAASSTTQHVTPGRQHFHPSAAKAWVVFNGTGVVAIRDDYSVSSITDNGTGSYTANFSTAFSGKDFAGVGFVSSDLTNIRSIYENNNYAGRAAGNFKVQVLRDFTANAQDAEMVTIAAWGDQ